MEYKETGKIGDVDKTRLLARILGELFEAEEVEIEGYGEWMFPEIKIKGHINIGFPEMTLLRHLHDYFDVSVDEEVEEMEEIEVIGEDGKPDKIKQPITRLVISIMPYENTSKELQGYKWVKEGKKDGLEV